MITGTTGSGFNYEIDDDALNDMELLDALCDLDRGDHSAISEVIRRLMGEQKKALYEHLRGMDGRVKADEVINTVAEILNACSKTKKS